MKYSGTIIHFDEGQKSYLNETDGGDKSFSDALGVPDWPARQLQVVLISFSGSTIDYICLATRGKQVVTEKYRVEFSDFVDLGQVSLKEIESSISKQLKPHFVKSSTGQGGRVPHKTWLSVLEILKEFRPNQKSEIDRLLSLKNIAKYRLQGDNVGILLQEREALGAALDIFAGANNLRRKVLRSWSPQLDDIQMYDDIEMIAEYSTPNKMKSSCFLSGISSRYIQEESAIQHDLINWQNLKATIHEMGVSRFEQGNRVLEVVYANKNALEHTLGVDLIYYNKEYHSFVLVQYKLMSEKNSTDGFYYRPNDQLDKEIKRMDEFNKNFSCADKIDSHMAYRLNCDGFMFKFVPNNGLQVASEQLIPGMYVTREYMEFLLSDKGPKGIREGKIISFKNSPRYLTNTEFSSSVNRGWIGSRAAQSDVLEQLVKKFFETGRALLVAVEVDNSKNNAQ